MRSLRLFIRDGCHLCEEMVSDLQRLVQDRGFHLELIDVERTPGKLDAYGSRVPVLESPDGECLSEYFLDEDKLMSYLRRA